MTTSSSARLFGMWQLDERTTIICPFRAFTSCIVDKIVESVSGSFAKKTEGQSSLINAIGPCFISASDSSCDQELVFFKHSQSGGVVTSVFETF
jgi:hypothetical protein